MARRSQPLVTSISLLASASLGLGRGIRATETDRPERTLLSQSQLTQCSVLKRANARGGQHPAVREWRLPVSSTTADCGLRRRYISETVNAVLLVPTRRTSRLGVPSCHTVERQLRQAGVCPAGGTRRPLIICSSPLRQFPQYMHPPKLRRAAKRFVRRFKPRSIPTIGNVATLPLSVRST